MTTTTIAGVADTENPPLGIDDNDTAAAFLSRLVPDKDADASKKKPSETEVEKPDTESEQEAPEETEETSEETPEETEETEEAEETEKKKTYVDSDEVFVKIKVGDQELDVPVKDLKRLHGQEAALTRKSQDVAERHKAVEQQQVMYAAGLDRMIKLATAEADEFRKVNFLALAKDPNINAEQLTLLQNEAQKVFEKEAFLKGELHQFVDAVTKDSQTKMATQARETVKVLSDKTSPLHIEGWNQQVYNDLRAFAVKQGLDKNTVDNLVDAPAFKLLHMAMMYSKGASKVVTTKSTKGSPKKIVKTSSSPSQSSNVKPAQQAKAMKALQKKGSVENAANAFLASFGDVDVD